MNGHAFTCTCRIVSGDGTIWEGPNKMEGSNYMYSLVTFVKSQPYHIIPDFGQKIYLSQKIFCKRLTKIG